MRSSPAEVGEQVENLVHTLLRGACAEHAPHTQILGDTELREGPVLLWHVAHATVGGLVWRQLLHLLTPQADCAVHHRNEARQRGEQRRLAGSVRAQHGKDLVADREIEAFQHGDLVVAAAEAFDLQDGRRDGVRHVPSPGTSRPPCGDRESTAGRPGG